MSKPDAFEKMVNKIAGDGWWVEDVLCLSKKDAVTLLRRYHQRVVRIIRDVSWDWRPGEGQEACMEIERRLRNALNRRA